MTYNIWTPPIILSDAFKNQQLTLEELTGHMNVVEVYPNGGTTLYKDRGKYSKYGFAVLVCKNAEKSNAVYIGPVFMGYEKGFCK